ncbi:hypothetical protein P6709_19475 [Jeotgalibacillus sp. ET6]|uniref:RCC1 domain-containing protein n=1 Tax=Jeotgalibacillus sp. ET6 TaxID=3037260 RepID=UPI00241878B6|nr:RCC1 domain-containing protein [Jeotgalibacillus sp. ET6]MDG5473911.1 hypothetical protein [Jeotgalibacillus sp. ET6]
MIKKMFLAIVCLIGFVLPLKNSQAAAIEIQGSDWMQMFHTKNDVYIWGFPGDELENYDHALEEPNYFESVPVRVENLKGMQHVFKGQGVSFGIKPDGSVWGWGDGRKGSFLQNSSNIENTPIKISELDGHQIKKIVGTNRGYNYAILKSGSVLFWGLNSRGESGLGHQNPVNTPITIPTLENIVDIKLNKGINNTSFYSLALTSEGQVLTWGQNNYGQLGNGTTQNKFTPTIVNGLENIKEIETMQNTSFALKKSGELYQWGDPSIPDTYYYPTLLTPKLFENNVKEISSSAYHFLVLTDQNKIYGYGWNDYSQLGSSLDMEVQTLQKIEELDSYAVKDIFTGGFSSYFILEDNTIVSIGYLNGVDDQIQGEPVALTGFETLFNSEMIININPGPLELINDPAFTFEKIQVEKSQTESKLTSDFNLTVNDFRGTHEGWSLQISFDPFVHENNIFEMLDPLVKIDCTLCNGPVEIIPNNNTPITLVSVKPGIQGSGNNQITLKSEDVTLNFSNKTLAGYYTGSVHFTLSSSP